MQCFVLPTVSLCLRCPCLSCLGTASWSLDSHGSEVVVHCSVHAAPPADSSTLRAAGHGTLLPSGSQNRDKLCGPKVAWRVLSPARPVMLSGNFARQPRHPSQLIAAAIEQRWQHDRTEEQEETGCGQRGEKRTSLRSCILERSLLASFLQQ